METEAYKEERYVGAIRTQRHDRGGEFLTFVGGLLKFAGHEVTGIS